MSRVGQYVLGAGSVVKDNTRPPRIVLEGLFSHPER
jgi:hypothetical protein